MENKLIIKKTIQEPREIDAEIPIPYYTKNGNHFYAVFGEKEVRTAYTMDDYYASLGASDTNHAFESALKGEECKEAEFHEAFRRAIDIIQRNVNLLVSVSDLPTEEYFKEQELKRDEHFIDLP